MFQADKLRHEVQLIYPMMDAQFGLQLFAFTLFEEVVRWGHTLFA